MSTEPQQHSAAVDAGATLHYDPNGCGEAENAKPRKRVIHWQDDLQAQIVARNASELTPTLSVFQSYAALLRRVLVLQQAESECARLSSKNVELLGRVRELEKVAADHSLRSEREAQLEAKRGELQERLQKYLETENEYYRGLAELSSWKERTAVAESRAAAAETSLRRRQDELSLIKKEYASLADEHAMMRGKLAEADYTLLMLKTANSKNAALEKRIGELEGELERVRAALARSTAQRNSTSTCRDGEGPPRSTEEEEAEEELLLRGGRSAAGSGPVRSSTTEASTALSRPYPSKVFRVIEDAHSGGVVQSCCVGDGSGGNREFFTSGSDKTIKLWGFSASSSDETKRFSSGGSAMCLHCSSHYLLAGCVDKTARFWDTRTLRVLELVGHEEKLVSCALSPTAQHAVTASSDSTIRLWDIRTRATLKTLLCQSTANDVVVAGDSIFSAHYNGNLCMWDRRTATKSEELPKVHQRIATCVRISNDGRLCVSLGKDSAISVRDTRVMARELRSLSPPQLSVSMNWTRLALSPDSKVCAVGGSRGQVLCCVLEKSNEAEVAGRYLGTAALPDDGVLTVLERGRQSEEAPVPCVAWGRGAGAPLISVEGDRCVVVWQ